LSPESRTSTASLFDVLRDLRERRATGVLEIDALGQKRRLYLRDGNVHLPGAHPLARRLGERLEALRSNKSAPGAVPDRELYELVERIAEVLSDWAPDQWRLKEGLSELSSELVGPLPTARLLMLGATVGLDDAEVERRVAGSGARYISARGSSTPPDALGLLPEEVFLIERLRLPMTWGEVAEGSPVPKAELARRLCQLLAVGWVASSAAGVAPVGNQLEREVLSRLSDRIERSLKEHPLDIDPEAYRVRVTEMLASFGGLDHYEILGVGSSATTDQVQAAYEDLARLVHPVNAARFGLGGHEGAMALLFEGATRAYETLMDPERRRHYNERQLIDVPASGPTGEKREEERRKVARAQYDRAQSFANSGDYHSAIQLLLQAVKTDPRAEYWSLLARFEARNPSWVGRALESYRQAIQLDPKNAEIRYASGQLFEQMGEVERARVQYGAAVRLDPNHFAAAERLTALQQARQTEAKGAGRNLLSRFFRRE
jgi:tetratricopeptide (TPR) repeat protein